MSGPTAYLGVGSPDAVCIRAVHSPRRNTPYAPVLVSAILLLVGSVSELSDDVFLARAFCIADEGRTFVLGVHSGDDQ